MPKIASAETLSLVSCKSLSRVDARHGRYIGAHFFAAGCAVNRDGQPAGSHPGTEYSVGMSNRFLPKIERGNKARVALRKLRRGDNSIQP